VPLIEIAAAQEQQHGATLVRLEAFERLRDTRQRRYVRATPP
jgi:hypothetical protein